MDEYLDYYDIDGKLLGNATRKVIHTEGMWHKTFHCWIIFKKENGQDYILMQRRSSAKDSAPNKLDCTVAGHYLMGESYKDGIREIKEEIGLDISVDELAPAGVRIAESISADGRINREFQEIFFVNKAVSLFELSLQKEEVAGMIEMPIDSCIRVLSGSLSSFSARGIFVDYAQNFNLNVFNQKISSKDFIIFNDNFHHKIMILAKQALLGDRLMKPFETAF